MRRFRVLACSSSPFPEVQLDRLVNTEGIVCKETLDLNDSYDTALRESNDFREVFEVVRRSVKEFLGAERTGLELYLRDLPLGVGAFHKVGTNIIVVNRALIDQVVQSQVALNEMKSFVYSILLHESLHSRGIYDELRVRRLTYPISREALGEAQPATVLAKKGPWAILNWGLTSRGNQWS